MTASTPLLVTFAAYLLLMVGIGLWAYRRKHSLSRFMAADSLATIPRARRRIYRGGLWLRAAQLQPTTDLVVQRLDALGSERPLTPDPHHRFARAHRATDCHRQSVNGPDRSAGRGERCRCAGWR
jgi:hypothetical protein